MRRKLPLNPMHSASIVVEKRFNSYEAKVSDAVVLTKCPNHAQH